jgi:FHA domain
VRDLGSRNGTYVHGVKLVDHQAQLKSGQIVRFGSVEARLELDEMPFEDTTSDMTAVRSLARIERERKWEEEHPKPANPAMKIESANPNEDANRTVTSLATIQQRETIASVPSAPPVTAPEKSSKAIVLVVAAIVAVTLVVFLWMR